jgi:hypothetical protein
MASGKSKQQEFLDQKQAEILEPGETVLARGTAEDPVKWALAIFTLGLLTFLRIFYYVILTDRRLIFLRTKKKYYFGFTPLPKLYISAGLNVVSQTILRHDQIAKIQVNVQSPIHILLGWRGMRFEDKGGQAVGLFLKRSSPGFRGEQSTLYNQIAATVSEKSGVKTNMAGKG